ncbi:MAG: shikimate kinase [Fimbriimonas sp.]
MMGAGKSTVGKALATLENREFLDTDGLLQARLGRPVAQIFSIYGEDTFRDHETSILKGLEPGPSVVSTGGGIVLRPENWEEMRRLGTTIFLDCTPETLIDRLERSKRKRPLLQVEDWEDRLRALLEQRLPLYRQADVVVSLDDLEIDDAALKVREAVRTRS